MVHHSEALVSRAEQKHIHELKLKLDNLYASGQIFQVSLKTLELSRRFQKLYTKFGEAEDFSRAELCNLLSIAKYLEENLHQDGMY
ncbi:hypothetical protein [Salegentibacter chungangensis]|uniref:Uncharacterized protein n=1 Tax=Salegentibacter chungangensis TaxID=1335724 RepID=A0ABW3NSL5_9FLAO